MVRNNVWARKVLESIAASTDDQIETKDQPDWKFQRKKATRKRRRGNQNVVKYVMADLEDSVEDGIDSEEQMNGDNDDDTRTSYFVNHPIVLGTDVSDSDESEEDETMENAEQSSSTTTNIQPQSKTQKGTTANDGSSEFEMVTEINDQFSRPDEAPSIGGSTVVRVIAHEWRQGHLTFKVVWSDDETTWEPLRDMKEDHPWLVAKYIVDNNVS